MGEFSMTSRPDDRAFLDQWNALERRERLRVRRVVRMGRRLAPGDEARLGVAYARFQRSRTWSRLFWIWFTPGLVVALGVAAKIHPIVVGAVLALGAQGAFAHVNLGRTEKINRGLTDP
jgi:hypothetical protein